MFNLFLSFPISDYDHFNVILHNIDGAGLRNSAAQKILSELAAVPGVHLIASLDHPNLPLRKNLTIYHLFSFDPRDLCLSLFLHKIFLIVWNQNDLDRFRWVYCHASTFAAYSEFPIPDLTVTGAKGSAVELSSLRHVFESLNPNAKLIYREIAKFQVQEVDKDSSEDPGQVDNFLFQNFFIPNF